MHLHCRFYLETDSDSHLHCQFYLETGSDSNFHCWLYLKTGSDINFRYRFYLKPTVMSMPPYIKQTTGHIHRSYPPTNSHICWPTRDLHSGVTLVSKLFSGLHVPRVKETPSLGFSGDGLLLSEV